MGAQNFNFVPKFHLNEGFLAPHFVFLEDNFPTRRYFSDGLKCTVQLPCHDAADVLAGAV